MVAERSFPRSDGFDWRNHPLGQLNYLGQPQNIASANGALATRNWIEGQHAHWYGMTDYYFLTGRRLRAASIQKLGQSDPYFDSSGKLQGFKPHYLITNRYTGVDNVGVVFGLNNVILPGELHGEVVEVRGLDYYLSTDNATNTYNGYRQPQVRLYTVNNGVLRKNLTSSIVWLFPMRRFPA